MQVKLAVIDLNQFRCFAVDKSANVAKVDRCEQSVSGETNQQVMRKIN
jgi:hypothetical protein